MRILLLSLTLILSLSASAEDWIDNSSGNFPDAVFRQWNLDHFPERFNADKTKFDVEGITELDLRGSGITRLRGIGNFHNLKKLNIYGLQLKDSELNTYPGLPEGHDYGLYTVETQLEVLIAGCNDTAHSTEEGSGAVLTTYNVGNMPNLVEFCLLDDDGENRNIQSLYFGNSPNLKKLVVRRTRISNISISSSTPIEYLDLYGNYMMTSRDIIENCKSTLKYANIVGVGIWHQPLNLIGASNLVYINTTSTPISTLRLNSCPKLTDVILDGCDRLRLLTIAFCNLSQLNIGSDASTGADPRNDDGSQASSFEVNIQDNNFTAIPDNLPEKMTILNISSNLLTEIVVPEKNSALKYLYCGSNRNFPDHLVIDGTLQNVEGLDLANSEAAIVGPNHFTKVTVDNCPNLKSLFFTYENNGGNNSLKELYIHRTGITHTSNAGNIQGDNGLQIKNMANLKVLDISYGKFDCLGAYYSMWGCGIEKLYASHNKFTTFTNAHIPLPHRVQQGNEKSNLEGLDKLKVLDLSWNELRDSVHLYRQTQLEELYLCHNREHCNPDILSDRNPDNSSWGLRCLNLCKNLKLKKLHYSYTLIKRTQLPTYWDENNEIYGCNAMNYYDVTNTSDPLNYTDGNIFQVCVWKTIEEIYADYNRMETTLIAHSGMAAGYTATSGGARAAEQLRILSQRGTNGQTDVAQIRGDLYLGANIGGTTICRYPKIEYVDFADSDFEHVYFPNELPELQYLDLSGNFNVEGKFHKIDNKNPDWVWNLTIDGANVPKLHELRINNTPLLKKIDIHDAPNLCSIQCEQSDPENCQIETVIIHHTAVPAINNTVYSINSHGNLDCGHIVLGETKNSGMNRIGDLRNLKHLEANHNHRLDSIDLSLNTKLEYLDVSHTSLGLGNHVTIDGKERQSTGLEIKDLNSLKTVKANYARLRTINHCNSLPNSIERLELDGNFKLQFLNLTGNTALKHLSVNNCNLFALDLSDCTSLEYLDCSNCLTNAIDGQCPFGLADTWTPPCIVIDAEGNAAAAEGRNDENTVPDGDFWNAIPELHIVSPNIKTVYAGRGNLYRITFSPEALRSIETLDIHNNHINALQDMSGADNLQTFRDDNNGRTIVAESNIFRTIEDGVTKDYWYYFFQLHGDADGSDDWNGHVYMGNRTSVNEYAFLHVDDHEDGDPYSGEIEARVFDKEGSVRVLADDCFLSGKVSGWTAGTHGTSPVTPQLRSGVATPGDMPDNHVYGQMMMLNPATVSDTGEATGHVEYNYDNKLPARLNHTSNYYINWTSTPPPVYTGIADIDVSNKVTSVRYYDLTGLESDTPFHGVNIVVTSFANGSSKVTKAAF